MTEKSKEYINRLDEQRKNRTTSEISMPAKLAEIVTVLSGRMTQEERGEIFNGKFNSKDELIDQYLDFILLAVKYMVFDLEASTREVNSLRKMLDDKEANNDDFNMC